MISKNSLIALLVLFSYIINYINCYSISKSPDDIHFDFHTDPKSSKEIKFGDNSSIPETFKKENPSVFLIHGFWSDKNDPMPAILKDAYLESKMKINIIVVDWARLVNSEPKSEDDKTPAFLDALNNFPIAAERIASFIMWLKTTGHIKLETLHIVGHSLGAHTSGNVGKIVKERAGHPIKRITSLDPAGPGFEFSLGMPSFQDFRRKISKDDAEFVDVIHTGMAAKGDTTFDGHADFYPNGGLTHPECPNNDIYGTCEHAIAVDYYRNTILGTKYKACMCDPEGMKSDGSECKEMCDKGTATVGEFMSTDVRGQYFFKTEK